MSSNTGDRRNNLLPSAILQFLTTGKSAECPKSCQCFTISIPLISGAIMVPSKTIRSILGPTGCSQTLFLIFVYFNGAVMQLASGRGSTEPNQGGVDRTKNQTQSGKGGDSNSIFRVSHKGKDCIRAMFRVNLTVEYDCNRRRHDDRMRGHQTCRADFGMPEPRDITVDGRCGSEPILILSWSNSNLSLTFKFRSEDKTWFADHLEFSFDPKDKHFPTASENKRKVLSAEQSLRLFVAPLGNSYFCNSTEIVDLGLGASRHASVELTESQVQVYKLPTETTFGGAHDCPADNRQPRSPVTAFVIASCLALLVIFMIAGYNISRRNNPSPYTTVN